MTWFMTKEGVDLQEIGLEDVAEVDTGAVVLVYNDDVNTFDWVIHCLMEICQHTAEQAEQCALLIHYKGKYGVKHGEADKLRPIKDALVDRGLNAVLDA